ncbi:MAG: 1-acyl-sn-glycerol-3-phosphate acyltransferase [Clostridia bacterium]|nr:1-acyl-sn-glycerol-3-phosphate acyltransferase [Clostridia bacterium]
MVYKIVIWIARQVIRLVFRVKVVGRENIPSEGNVVVCYNHRSAWDGISIALYNKRRKLILVAKKELFKNKLFAPILKYFGGVPVNRGTADLRMFKTVSQAMNDKNMIAIAPYGTRVKDEDLKNVKVHAGAMLIATKADAWVVPCTVDGDFKFWHKITLTFGKPRKYTELTNGAEMQEATWELMREIEAVRGVTL